PTRRSSDLRGPVERIACQQCKKPGIAAGRGGDQFAQLLDEVRLTGYRLQVEEDVAVEQCPGVGALHPLAKIAFPYGERLAPAPVGSHDVALAVAVAAGGQPVADEGCQAQKIVVVL